MTTSVIVYNSSNIESKICAAYVSVMENEYYHCDRIVIFDINNYTNNSLKSELFIYVENKDNKIYFAGTSIEEKIGENIVFNTYIIEEISENAKAQIIWCDNCPNSLSYFAVEGYQDEYMHKFMCCEVFFENTTGILPYNIHKYTNIENETLYNIEKEVKEYVYDFKTAEKIIANSADIRNW